MGLDDKQPSRRKATSTFPLRAIKTLENVPPQPLVCVPCDFVSMEIVEALPFFKVKAWCPDRLDFMKCEHNENIFMSLFSYLVIRHRLLFIRLI